MNKLPTVRITRQAPSTPYLTNEKPELPPIRFVLAWGAQREYNTTINAQSSLRPLLPLRSIQDIKLASEELIRYAKPRSAASICAID